MTSKRVLMLLTKPLRYDARVHREATALQQAGHDVTVMEWARHEPQSPREEIIHGVPVVRVHGGTAMRLLGHDLLRNPVWWRKAASEALRMHRDTPIDVVHCHDLDTLPAGARIKRHTGARLVFDAHEPFRLMLEGNLPAPLPRLAEALERRLLPKVDLVLTVKENFAEPYRRFFDGPVEVVMNCFWNPPSARYRGSRTGTFTVLYIGTFSRDRMFPEIVDALGNIEGVRVVLGGKPEGVYKEVESRARRYGNIEFLGPVPFEEIKGRSIHADLLIALYDPDNLMYATHLANKAFDAMAVGRPILVTKGTYMADFVEREGIGASVEYEPQAVREALQRLSTEPLRLKEMGRRGLQLARKEYNWPNQAKVLLSAYSRL